MYNSPVLHPKLLAASYSLYHWKPPFEYPSYAPALYN